TRELRPDVVVLDLGLPDLAGQDVLTQVREHAPHTRVVVFSAAPVDGAAVPESRLEHLAEILEDADGSAADERTLGLDGALTSARRARRFTSTTLGAWGSGELLEDALVVVTELVNNAVTHAHGPCELRISSGPRALRV